MTLMKEKDDEQVGYCRPHNALLKNLFCTMHEIKLSDFFTFPKNR